MTITSEQRERLHDFLDTHTLGVGIGELHEPCSIAAINLILTRELTDTVPECMSLVIGRWIIFLQDWMRDEPRNSPAWKWALVDALDTGRDAEKEKARADHLVELMWDTLPVLQATTELFDNGAEWREAYEQRTESAWTALKKKQPVVPRALWNVVLTDGSHLFHRPSGSQNSVFRTMCAASVTARVLEIAGPEAWNEFDPAAKLTKLVNL